ncbi:HAD-IA family hydrolase [Phormidium sp. CCY1219]|uniref:HAD-IA family hydrolase n=1 Tax=Phormidium sp. CCY1219 TaxID=2886104 RepID=UPI002D1F79FB|nr:HAD-IA family hydrolase [Phormidium sp. CCY1219]MEB3830974.1 HAD-IA family hydrolase [Phormidium sp. CCY1219]
MNRKVVLFDFDGTLVDSLEAIVRITNRLSGEFGYQKATAEDVEALRNLNSMQIIKTAKVPLAKVPFLLQMVKLELNQEIQNLKPIAGIIDVLADLKSKGYPLGIVTSNSQDNVKTFLHNYDLHEVFSFVHSGSTLFGKSKVIKKFLRQEKFLPEEVIYVGDETRDIEAAKNTRVQVIAVSWGFNSKEVLVKHNPDFALDRPEELIAAIGHLQQS